MFKKLFLIIGVLAILASPSLAFTQSQISSSLVYQELRAYNKDFDILALDFTLNNLNGDTINALTVYNSRTANSDDIAELKLWLDDGDGVWQGYLVDHLIASAERIDSKRWLFNNLNTTISSSKHFYISIETKSTVVNQHKLQLEIDSLYDANANQVYDTGDTGLFVASKDNGPVGQSFVSNYVYTFEQKGGDTVAPKVVLTNLKNNDVLAADSSTNFLNISGGAKDRMGGTVKFVKISVVPAGQAPVWKDVNALTTDFATWDYTVNNLASGQYNVQTYVSDWDSNSIISDILTFTVNITSEDNNPEPPVPPADDNQNNNQVWSGGRLLKTPASAAVYWLYNNKIYSFLNDKIFFQYFTDFSQVENISVAEIANYELGSSVPVKPGTLIQSVDSNKVYEVNGNWQRRWLKTASEAESLYGEAWESKIQAVSGAYIFLYTEVENL